MGINDVRDEEIAKKLEKLKKESAYGPKRLYSSDEEISKVEIRVDKSMAPGQFKPSKIVDNLWYANELTYRAMKKDIWLLGDEALESEDLRSCLSCNSKWDIDFWNFCPKCAGKLEK